MDIASSDSGIAYDTSQALRFVCISFDMYEFMKKTISLMTLRKCLRKFGGTVSKCLMD